VTPVSVTLLCVRVGACARLCGKSLPGEECSESRQCVTYFKGGWKGGGSRSVTVLSPKEISCLQSCSQQ